MTTELTTYQSAGAMMMDTAAIVRHVAEVAA